VTPVVEPMPELKSDPLVGYEPFDFSAEADSWCWFEPVDGQEFDEFREMMATLPRDLYDALDGHLPHDPTMCSMKEYESREAAIEALRRAARG
jgi:hypothetical protein